jgi:hypothetical protein
MIGIRKNIAVRCRFNRRPDFSVSLIASSAGLNTV